MKFLEDAKRVVRNTESTAEGLRHLVAHSVSQSQLVSERLSDLVSGISDLIANSVSQSQLLDQRLSSLAAGISSQSELIRELVANSINQSELLDQQLSKVVAGLANQSDLLNRKLDRLTELTAEASLVGLIRELVANSINQSELLDQQLSKVVAGVANQSDVLNRKLDRLIDLVSLAMRLADPPQPRQLPPGANAGQLKVNELLGHEPLLIDEKTYNTSHPDYDATIVRNFPGRIFNADQPCDNVAYAALRRVAPGIDVPGSAWNAILAEIQIEARSVPHADQIFERRAFIEEYLAKIGREHQAHYLPGWVNLDDALFLYWLVRQIKPRKIVQTGVCNGLSSAFMMLALVKNGHDGTLSVIDLPPVFDPKDPDWKIKGHVYGFVVPEGKTSGWMVPDAYRDRLEVWAGNARELLPKMVDKMDSIDLFYHDSDHTYNHMAFEFCEVHRKLNKGGLVVADDISWNASLWDFADERGAPSYNFRGAVGVAFF